MRLSSFLTSALLLSAPVAAWADEHGHDDAHGATGLPQLDISTFPSQLFWLVVTGVTLYILMSKFALPKIEQIMRARDAFVHDNLRKAADLRRQAEDVKIDYDRSVRQAENHAKEFLANTLADLRAKHDAALQETLNGIAARTAESESRLQKEKDQIMASLDQHATRLADDIMMSVFETKPAAL